MEREGKKEADILDLLAALHAGRRMILGGTLGMCVLAGALSFLVPEEFEATAQILPPKEQKQGFGFSDLLSALPIPTLRLGEKGTPADIFIATLTSQMTRRQMVEKYDLQQRYEAETMTDAIEILAAKTTVDKTEDGTILIAVLDQDPQRAADMAAHYIELLDVTNKQISQKTAHERLGFIRQLLYEEDRKLEDKMERLEEFQSEYNAISIEEQARAVIRAAAGMQTEAMELEIARKGLILSGLDAGHDRVKKLQREIQLREEMMVILRDGLEVGAGDLLRNKTLQLELDENLFLPLKQIPGVAQEYATLEKDVLVQKALLQLLLQQEAEALIEASNTTSTVQVLDPPVPPEIKARPERLLIVLITGVLSLFASVCYTLGVGYVRSIQHRWRERSGPGT
jgi:LPS O-antigen subunit length determinant protein (WzzB/FepE family)